MPLKNLRQNPIDSSTSPVAIANESHTVAEFDELPGVYGFILEERPVAGSVTITSDDTAADVFSIVTTDPLAGQAFVDFNTNRGYVIFNPSENGRAMLVDYDGLGANMTVESVDAMATAAAEVAAAAAIAAAIAAGLTLPTGAYIEHAGATAPAGFLACDGAAVSRTTYANLFAVISTTYGAGNGTTTFNVPDRRGISSVGAGSHGTMTRADASAFDGGSIGATRNDQIQGHKVFLFADESGGDPNISALDATTQGEKAAAYTAGNNAYSMIVGGTLTAATVGLSSTPTSDGTNGTPRTGNETRPAQMAVLVCIKT